jgi:methylmalonyl-CoA/ethylmalonyl-CoA epimerase
MGYVVDHIGFVVKDLEKAIELYSKLFGATVWSRGAQDEPRVGVRTARLMVGKTVIALVQPTRSDNRTGRFLDERGEGINHICFAVEDLNRELEIWKEKGFVVKDDESGQSNIFPGHTIKTVWLAPGSSQGEWIELIDVSSIPESLRPKM